MRGGIAKADATGQAERWPGNYQWQWHPMNRLWTIYITGMPGFDVCFFKKKTEKALV
jgi:hypothetical protein